MADENDNNLEDENTENELEVENERENPTTKGGVRTESLDAVYDVPVQISAVLGRATMPVNQLLKLGRGAVVELDKRVGESIDIFVNNKLVARGEVVAVEDRLGITMTEIV
jgi:flagellar motor switch protein FliN/FliY